MTLFWYLSWLDEASECVAEGVDDPDRDRLLSGSDQIEDWPVPRLEVESDELAGYLPNNLGVRLCSMPLRDLIDESRGPDGRVQWLPVEVVDVFGTSHDYVVLHMPGDEDVLDASRSIMAGDFVVKPIIDVETVKGRHVFRLSEAMLTTFISADLKARLEEAAVTGVHFEPAPTG